MHSGELSHAKDWFNDIIVVMNPDRFCSLLSKSAAEDDESWDDKVSEVKGGNNICAYIYLEEWILFYLNTNLI